MTYVALLGEAISTSSPTFTASNNRCAKGKGTPMHPWVAAPHLTLLPWIDTPSPVSRSVKGIDAS